MGFSCGYGSILYYLDSLNIDRSTMKNVQTYLESLGRELTDIKITVVSPARMRKKSNPYRDVSKVQTLTCQVNYDYEALMAKKEGAWVSNHRTWGRRLKNQCLISHKEELYVSVHVLKAIRPLYFSPDDGIIPFRSLDPWLYTPSTSPVRDINIKNIVIW